LGAAKALPKKWKKLEDGRELGGEGMPESVKLPYNYAFRDEPKGKQNRASYSFRERFHNLRGDLRGNQYGN